jgi:acyl transferase domain-containing protein/NAD(P)-dependent dehydrogenase (short-subunit alcohol dehydrogenase family)/acyl carrier protein
MRETAMANRSEPLAVIGIGCLFPAGSRDASWYWAAIKGGVDGIAEVPPSRWSVASLEEYYDSDPKAADRTYARRGAFLEAVEFDPLAFGIAPRDLEATDSTQLLALVAAQQALADAGIEVVDERRDSVTAGDRRRIRRDRVAVILGVTGPQELVIPLGARLAYPQWRRGMQAAGIAPEQIEEAVRRIGEQFVSWQENSFPGLLGNVVAGRIANRLNLGGTNCVVDAACASALAAVEMAALELETGRADVVITGGCDTFSDIFMYMCFSKTPALSRTGDARPFDADGDGTILGEGLGLVVLKRLGDAVAAGDRIYAVVRGIGSSSDGRGTAIYAPSAEGQQRCLRSAYERAGISPVTVELVEAHGTGTRVGDATEAQALIAVYQQAASQQAASRRTRPWCALGSVKSQIGHTKAAAGAASLIKAVLALYHKVLPPTLKVRQPVEPLRAPDCPFYLNTTLRPWLPRAEHPRRAAVSAFGFGGSNFHAVLEEYSPCKTAPDWTGQVEILPLAGESLEDLRAAVAQLPDHVDELFLQAEQARQQWKPTASFRLLLVLTRQGPPSRRQWLNQVWQRLPEAAQQRQLTVRPGAYLGYGAVPGGLAVLFPGQGSQYVGMLRELACLFPEMLESLAQANAACGEEDGWRLSDRIYPPAAFDDSSRQQQTAELRATEWAQPALGAIGWGAWRVLRERFGLAASAWAGHSYGELVALAAAGCYTPETLYRLSRERGRLLAAAGQCTPGGMLAVRASRDVLEQWIAQHQWQVVVANRNGPEQQVLSGPLTEIERTAAFLQRQGVGCVRLAVSGAFHSPWVQSAVEPFHRLLNACDIQIPQGRVYANATAAPYPPNPAGVRTLLAEQLVRPVAFQEQVQRMLQDGLRCFVEVGPGTVLTRLVNTIIRSTGAAEAVALPLDASAGQGSGVEDLAHLLAQVAALGYPVHLEAWERESRCRPLRRQTPRGRWTVSISGANYVAPKAASAVPASPPPASSAPSAAPVPAASGPAASSPLPPSRPDPASASLPCATLPSSALATPSAAPTQPSVLAPSAPPSALASAPPSAVSSPANTLKQPSLPKSLFPGTTTMDHTRIDPSVPARNTDPPRDAPRTSPVAVPAAADYVRTGSDPGADCRRHSETAPASAGGSVAAGGGSSDGDARPGVPVTRSADPWHQLLQLTWQSLALVQRIQEQTAALHKQFLDAQETAQRTLLALLEQQRQLWGGGVPLHAVSAVLSGSNGVPTGATFQGEAAPVPPSPWPSLSSPAVADKPPSTSLPADLGTSPPSVPPGGRGDTPPPAARLSGTTVQGAHRSEVPPQGVAPVPVPTAAPAPVSTLATSPSVTSSSPSAPPSAVAPVPPASPPPGSTPASAIPGPAPVSTSAPAPASGAATDSSSVAGVVLQVVSEKTGYPVESLGWDLVLDADLGIDSIKRVEIFSALQERLPGAPAVQAEHVGRLQTLRDVIHFLTAGNGTPAPQEKEPIRGNGGSARGEGPDFFPPAFPVPPPLEAARDTIPDPSNSRNGPVVAEAPSPSPPDRPEPIPPRGEEGPRREGESAAVPLSSLAGDWTAVLSRQVLRSVPWSGGVRPAVPWPQAGEVWLVADEGDVLAAEVGKALAGRGLSVRHQAWEAAPAGTPTGSWAGLILVAPLQERPFHPGVLAWLQRAAKAFPRSGDRRAFLVGLIRLDGQFGLGPLRPDTPVGQSGLAGWIKTARWEWPHVACKVIDVAPEWSEAPEMAEEVAAEVLADGPIEIGLSEPWQRWVPVLKEEPLDGLRGDGPLQADDVVLITGGGRGVTADLAQALAEAGRGTLVLVGRTPLPTGDLPSWWPESEEEAVLKRAVAEHLGPGASPRQIQEQYQLRRAQQELQRTLQRLSAQGARIAYYSLDIADQAAVQHLVAEVRQRWGPITRLIHGAGVLADRRLEDLTAEQFERVYRTKVIGLEHLLAALGQEPLRTLAVFSSTTARLGRTGQGAYACANEVLNKLMQREARRRPQTRVIAFNWGPWDGGMVTSALKRLFAAEGVGLIPRQAGGRYGAWEIQKWDSGVEIVISARTSGKDVPTFALTLAGTSPVGGTGEPLAAPRMPSRGNGEGTAFRSNGVTPHPAPPRGAEMTLAFERPLDVSNHPVLADHVLEGRAVVPVALHLEWLAHAAVHRHPGLQFCGCDQLRIYHGLMLEASESAVLQVWCGPSSRQDGGYWQTVEVRSRGAAGREWLHARACVLVAEQWPAPPPTEPIPEGGQPWPWSMEDTYEHLLFHGPQWRGVRHIQKLEDDLWLARVRTAPPPAQWLTSPLRSAWLADPLVLDGALQLLIVAAYEHYQLRCLPVALGRYRQYRRHFPATETTVLLRLRCREHALVQADIEFRDDHGLIAQIQDCEAVLQEQLARAFRNNRLRSH